MIPNENVIPIFRKDNNFNSTFDFLEDYLLKRTPTTYDDKECNEVQCYFDRNRSINDLWRLTKSFDKEILFKDFCKLINQIVLKNENDLAIWVCPDIQQVIVFNKNKGSQHIWFCSYPINNPNFSNSWYKNNIDRDDSYYNCKKAITFKEFINIVEKI